MLTLHDRDDKWNVHVIQVYSRTYLLGPVTALATSGLNKEVVTVQRFVPFSLLKFETERNGLFMEVVSLLYLEQKFTLWDTVQPQTSSLYIATFSLP